MVFARLPSFSLRYQGSGRLEDVHLFMTCLYRFWYYKGLWSTCLASCVDFLNSVVIFFVVLFLTMMLDWPVALTCDEVSCGNSTLVHGLHSPALFGVGHLLIASILLLATFVALCYEFLKFLETCFLQKELESMLKPIVDGGYLTPLHRLVHLWRVMRARSEGHEEVHLTGDLPFIGNMSWGNFLDTVCAEIQRDRNFGVVAHREFDSLRAVQALMVYDNYFITLYQHGILDHKTLKYADERLLKILLCGMFDEFNTLDSGKDQISLVQRQVLKYFVFYTLLYPFVVTLFLLRVLVKNAAMMRSDWGNYISRDWNNRARCTFRLYNEVPHILSARISAGRQTAIHMVERLQPYSPGTRFIRRTSSAIVFVTVFLSLLNTSLLVSGSVAGISLIWWLSIALIAFSICSGDPPVHREYNYVSDLNKLIDELHYSQENWLFSGDSFYHAITWDFLRSRFSLILGDIIRTLLMPFILIGILYDGSIPAFVDCINHCSVRVDGLGSVARDSVFDYQDQSEEELSPGKHFNDKCAKSIASFCSVYAGWAKRCMLAAAPTIEDSGAASTSNALSQFVLDLHERVGGRAAPSLVSESQAPAVRWELTDAHERERLFVSHVMSGGAAETTNSGPLWDSVVPNTRE
ncbi:putative proteasome regulatory non-ATPase subunit [Trypanosoma theileri]|uniref:Autophagy-related protein 9 n=1 Tax=Trypanosoma theileri TaxID=67003 RepID=A0A1X0P5B9_9TRYP|nr:putative proteasome regulatory non-ATPase subunit [Trypanosoma theileri]ORC91620.1 putative proteasome regulatory non-ATPase subunit [Trypanosoma theileri]